MANKPRVLSLFSGIGGLDLGLERAGMEVVGQSEINPYACRVLKKHWPDVPNLGDITKITEADLEGLNIDVIAGGFPCQDLSGAGKQAGINASRSGLFFEIIRLVRMVRPKVVILENVPALLHRAEWMGAVLGELASCGYDAEWDCVPARSVGACHQRDRVFIIAYAGGVGGSGISEKQVQRFPILSWVENERGIAEFGVGPSIHAPIFRRTGDGVPSWVDRLRGLGNAVVPQVAEHIGRCVMARLF